MRTALLPTLLFLVCLPHVSRTADAPPPSSPPLVEDANGPLAQVPFLAAAMSEVFSDSRPFSAVAIVQFPGDQPGQGVPLGFATLNGKMRWYLNLDQLSNSRIEPEWVNLLRDARLGQLLLILRPQTNAILAVPGLRQWFEFPVPKSPALVEKAEEKVGFLTKTEVGRDVVDGHPCVKYRLSLPKDRGTNEEAFVWQATDMKNFPIKFQVRVGTDQYGLLFRQIRDASPDPQHFEPPAGYAKAGGLDSLMQKALMGSIGDAGGINAPPQRKPNLDHNP